MLLQIFLFIIAWLIPIHTYASGPVIINEIMYNVSGADAKREWIEIKNISSYRIDLHDWRFGDSSSPNHKLVNDEHPEYFTVDPQGLVVIASDIATFLSEHQGFTGHILDTIMNLKNSEDTISIHNTDNTMSNTVNYHSSWGGNGGGKSLERVNASSEQFKESEKDGGSPGQENEALFPISPQTEPSSSPTLDTGDIASARIATPVPHSSSTEEERPASSSPQFGVLITEFLPNPDAQGDEWIELHNTNTVSTTLAGWYLEDSAHHTHTFSTTVMAPEAYMITPYHESKIHINNTGDALSLFNETGSLVSKISFEGNAPKGQSFARRGDNDWMWTTTPTPGFPNIFTIPVPKQIHSTQTNSTTLADISAMEVPASQNSLPLTQNKSSNHTTSPLVPSLFFGLFFAIMSVLFIKKFI
ncbi:MAG: lamin tail domain-containing protein [Patescibacteria group bacterium]|nr:lamin tail domain-containing protein [Patescibacteria group bacterium]MDE2438472.1 lamin tail domain-containing protein [Patescibacteria group bacterium]